MKVSITNQDVNKEKDHIQGGIILQLKKENYLI